MNSRWSWLLFYTLLLPGCALVERDVLKLQLLDNVRAGYLSFQAYDIPAEAIEQIELASGRTIDIQFEVTTIVGSACIDEGIVDEYGLPDCTEIRRAVDWLDVSTSMLCLTAEPVDRNEEITKNLCLNFQYSIPFPTDYSKQSHVVNLTLQLDKAVYEDGTTYIEVIEAKIH